MMNLKEANAFLLVVSCFCSTAQHCAKKRCAKQTLPEEQGICPLSYLKVWDTNNKETPAIR